jgi:uncharacterized protein
MRVTGWGLKLGFASLAITGVAINGVAWLQARGMTHYVSGGERPAKPEQLTWADKLKLLITGVQLPRPENLQTPAHLGLPYQTHRIELPNQEWLETWRIAKPATRPKSLGVFLLFPPYGGSKDSVLAAAKALHELGYDTLLVDYRGVGGSSGNSTTLGVKEADDVVAAVNYAQARWSSRPLYLYGASMGAAAVARAVALKGVQPQAIILESSFDRLTQTVRHRFTAMGWPSSPGTELIIWWGGWQHNIDAFAHNPIDYAKAIRQPTLLFYGQADRRVTLTETQAIFAQLPGKKQLRLFNGVGHGSLAAEAPTQWKQQVQEFLRAAQSNGNSLNP